MSSIGNSQQTKKREALTKPFRTIKIKKAYIYLGVLLLVTLVFLLYRFNVPKYSEPNLPRPMFGNSSAKVKVVEYSDLQCPACGRAHPVVELLKSEYKDRVSFTYKHYPLPIHAFAEKAAEAAECAHDQGAFFEYVDTAFNNQEDLSVKSLKKYAELLGLNTTSFNACLDSGVKETIVNRDVADGRIRGVSSTPSFFVNGVRLETWSYPTFKAAVESALNQ